MAKKRSSDIPLPGVILKWLIEQGYDVVAFMVRLSLAVVLTS
jgi:hypothetical protein